MNATTVWESVLADLESSTHQEQFSDMSCSFRECELIITKGDLEYTEDLPMSSAGNKNCSPLLFIIYLSVNVKFTVAYSYFKGRFHLTERLCFPYWGIPNNVYFPLPISTSKPYSAACVHRSPFSSSVTCK